MIPVLMVPSVPRLNPFATFACAFAVSSVKTFAAVHCPAFQSVIGRRPAMPAAMLFPVLFVKAQLASTNCVLKLFAFRTAKQRLSAWLVRNLVLYARSTG